MATRVVNRHHYQHTPGRLGIYIGRGTIWGNAWSHDARWVDQAHLCHDRYEAIEKYRQWFDAKMETDPEFRRQTMDLRDCDLICSCYPQPCHGDVIRSTIDGTR